MTDVGSQLRTAREAQGLTVEQAYKATRIKSVYLEAIEANRMSVLPGPVQARGFVRSYANFLGLDGEVLASALDAAPVLVTPTQNLAAKPAPIKPAVPTVSVKPLAPAPDRAVPRGRTLELPSLPKINVPTTRDTSSASPGGVPTTVLIIGAIVLFVVGLLLIISALTSTAKPAPSNNPTDVNVPAVVKPAVFSTTTETAASAGPLSITVMADEHVWVRVAIDGQTAYEGQLQPGSSQNWTAVGQVLVETGNAAAVKVAYNGRTSVLGARGQIVARAWSSIGSKDVPVAASSNVTRTGAQAAPVSISTSILRP